MREQIESLRRDVDWLAEHVAELLPERHAQLALGRCDELDRRLGKIESWRRAE